MAKIENSVVADDAEKAEKEEISCTADGIANWDNHCGNQSGCSQKI